MGRPEYPGCILTAGCITRIREEQMAYDRNPEEYERHKRDWSLSECIARGSLPTGESIEALYGAGYWTEEAPDETK